MLLLLVQFGLRWVCSRTCVPYHRLAAPCLCICDLGCPQMGDHSTENMVPSVKGQKSWSSGSSVLVCAPVCELMCVAQCCCRLSYISLYLSLHTRLRSGLWGVGCEFPGVFTRAARWGPVCECLLVGVLRPAVWLHPRVSPIVRVPEHQCVALPCASAPSTGSF